MNELNVLAAQVLATGAHILNAPQGGLRDKLADLVTDSHFASVVALAHQQTAGVIELHSVDARLEEGARKKGGVYFTPPELADFMACALPEGTPVVDPSCGAGELLLAAIRRGLGPVLGIEPNPVLALAAAIRIRSLTDSHGHKILCADSLDAKPWSNGSCVLSNPPYLGEKGNKRVFDAIRQEHPELAGYFGARGDLLYVFIRRALDLMEPGATAVFLTSEYWLSASGAEALRQDLRERACLESLWQLGAGRFPQAPGHHSLVFRLKKKPVETPQEFAFTLTTDAEGAQRKWTIPSEGVWSPFTDETAVRGGICLSEVLDDYQGFVTGADRVFIRKTPVETSGEHMNPLWRPVLRARDCVSNRVFFRPPDAHDSVLWLDQEVCDPEILALVDDVLGPVRERLEARREVKNGRMPWYRIHWPRRIEDQLGPKLVVPRRATEPRFCLDLTGSAVSSDCTYLVCRPGLNSIERLVELMVILNHSNTAAHLAHAGKHKGAITEFYSAPLRGIPVGEWGEVTLQEALEALTGQAIAKFYGAAGSGFVDVCSP